MSAATHVREADQPHAHFKSSMGQMMMVIQDNDLANVIQAERRLHAARERLAHESVTTARDRAPRFNLYLLGAAWLRAHTPAGCRSSVQSGGANKARSEVLESTYHAGIRWETKT